MPVVLTSQRGHRKLTWPPVSPVLAHRRQVYQRHRGEYARYMRRHLIEAERVHPDLIDLCYNGVDVVNFSPGPSRRPDDLVNANPLIGTVCALRREKGLPALIRAFAAVLSVRPGARLMIVGSGPEQAALRQLASALGVEGACHFQPAVSGVVPWLRVLDIFVLPSREEALSNAIIEAMACGICVVASEVGGNPELIGQNERGLLFPIGDDAALAGILLELAGDGDRRGRLAALARGWVERTLSISAMADRMGAIYDKHLGNKRLGGTVAIRR